MNHRDKCSFWKLTKSFLMGFGLWPYQSRFSKRVLYYTFVIYAVSCLLPMLQGFVEETEIDIVIFFESIVGTTTVIGGLGQCSSLYFRVRWVKKLCDHIEFDWESITDPEELGILEKHSRHGRLLSVIYIGTFAGGYIWFLSLTYIPVLLNKGVAQKYLRSVPYYSNRWIIDERYHNLQVFLHLDMGIFYAEFVYMAATSFYICSVHHICAIYKIVSLRLRKLMTVDGIIHYERRRNDEEVISKLLDIINQHKQAIEEVHSIRNIFSRAFFIIELGALICLAMLIFHCNYNIGRSWLLSGRIFFITAMFVEYLFYLNYGGQQIIDYSENVLISTRFMHWYNMSNNARNFLLMIIHRSLKSDILSAGIMTLSLENFTSIIKVSWSLACVLLSTQKKT